MNTDVNSSTTSVSHALQAASIKSGKTMSMIAMQSGFSSTEEWMRVLDGHDQLPGLRIAAVAKAVGLNVMILARLTIAEHNPQFLDLFDAIPLDMLTANERRMVNKVREMTADSDAEILVADGRDLVAVVMV